MPRLPVIAFLLLSALPAFASDIGFATQYHNWASNDPEYNLGFTPFFIGKATPGTWVRSDIGWLNYEYSPGVYSVYSNDDQWIRALAAAGQKVVAIFNQYYHPSFYPEGGTSYAKDASGSSPAARFLSWFATEYKGVVSVIELGNEIQNSWGYWGTTTPTAEANYVSFATEATAAVHAADPNMQVIGYCAQGSQITDMLNLGGTIDGVVYHPYNSSNEAPEGNYEPPFNTDPNGFINFYKSVQAVRPIPVWFTEMGQNSGASEYEAAVWDVRRLVMSLFLKVAHIGFYQLIGSDSGQSVFTYTDYSRFCNFGINLTYSTLGSLTPDANPVTSSVSPPSGVIYGEDFFGPIVNGQPPVTTCAVVWVGQVLLKGPYGALSNTIESSNITATHVNAQQVTGIDLVTGVSQSYPFIQSGSNVVIAGTISQHPVAYIISSTGGASGIPTPTPTPSQSIVQTGNNSYGAWTNNLSVTFGKPENAGDTVTVTVNHSSGQTVSGVTDLTRNVYKQTSTATLNGITTEVWTATPIVACGFNNATSVAFSAATLNPSMTVTETN